VLLYHAQTYFAWSLLCEGTNAYSSTSTKHELTKRALESYLQMSFTKILGYRRFAKVNSIHLNNLGMIFENWLLFECGFAFLVSFVGFMEGEGTIKSCNNLSLKNDYMVNPKFKTDHLPLPHDHGAQESRTTLLEAGGDDAARHSVFTMSHTISGATTYIKSSWTSKVNSILYASPIPSHMSGIQLHTPSHGYARLVTMSTGAWEEVLGARSLKNDIIEAWKRRRKKRGCPTSSTTSPRSSTASLHPGAVLPLPGEVLPPSRQEQYYCPGTAPTTAILPPLRRKTILPPGRVVLPPWTPKT